MARIYYPGLDPEPDPDKKRELRFDQLIAIEQAVREVVEPGRSRAALIGAGMGSGKTTVSCEIILRTNAKRVLVVGVKGAANQWAEVLRDQSEGKRELLLIDNTKQGKENLAKLVGGEKGIFYIGLEMLRSQDWEIVSETYPVPAFMRGMFGGASTYTDPVKRSVQKGTYAKMPPLDLLISDESHKHSNQKSVSIKTLRTIRSKAKIALSGTFFGNKFENAWTLATWLWGKDVIGSKGMFEKNYCVKVPIMSKDGKRQITSPRGYPLTKIAGERNPGEYVETLPCYVFIETPVGPPPEPETVYYDLHPEQRRQYDEMERQSLTWLKDERGVEVPLVADLPITQRMRLRTAALGGMTLVPGASDEDPDSITFLPGSPSSALIAAYHVLHRPTWTGKKALILTHSKQFAIEAARRIGQKYTVALKTGDTKPSVWEEEKARFMLDPSEPGSIQYLVAVISAVGTATDGLQANCSRVLWLSEDDNNINNIQGANRVWRLGGNLEDYEAAKLVARDTVADSVRAKNEAHKRDTMKSVASR